MATLESIEALLREFKKNTEKHFEKLNGKVAENTAFRLKFMGALIVLSILSSSTIVSTILLWNKIMN